MEKRVENVGKTERSMMSLSFFPSNLRVIVTRASSYRYGPTAAVHLKYQCSRLAKSWQSIFAQLVLGMHTNEWVLLIACNVDFSFVHEEYLDRTSTLK